MIAEKLSTVSEMYDFSKYLDPIAKMQFQFYSKFYLFSKLNTLVIFTMFEI